MKRKVDYSLYLCTDRGLMSTQTLEEAVKLSIEGGCTLIQLREKDCSSREFYNTAINIKRITDEKNVPLIINDRVDIALAVDADGVHIGQSDLPASEVRKIIGEDKILGVSANTVDKAIQAEKDGADYLGVGAMFTTGTKKDAVEITMEDLKRIRKAVNIPIVVIGGINKENAGTFVGTGIDGLAVVSAVIAAKDIKGAALELLKIFKK